eukprot:Platyproteum_vivax@DN6707_c0_g1_i2.p1
MYTPTRESTLPKPLTASSSRAAGWVKGAAEGHSTAAKTDRHDTRGTSKAVDASQCERQVYEDLLHELLQEREDLRLQVRTLQTPTESSRPPPNLSDAGKSGLTRPNKHNEMLEKKCVEMQARLVAVVAEAREKNAETIQLRSQLEASKQKLQRAAEGSMSDSGFPSFVRASKDSLQGKLLLLKRIAKELQTHGFVSARATELLQGMDTEDDEEWLLDSEKKADKKDTKNASANTEASVDWEAKVVHMQEELCKSKLEVENLKERQLNKEEQEVISKQNMSMQALFQIAFTEALATEQLLLDKIPGPPLSLGGDLASADLTPFQIPSKNFDLN